LALDVADANNFNVSLKKARQTIAEMLEPVRGRQLGHKEVIGSKGNKQYQFHPELRVLGLVGGRHLRALSRI
jgi:hypothetical protein